MLVKLTPLSREDWLGLPLIAFKLINQFLNLEICDGTLVPETHCGPVKNAREALGLVGFGKNLPFSYLPSIFNRYDTKI